MIPQVEGGTCAQPRGVESSIPQALCPGVGGDEARVVVGAGDGVVVVCGQSRARPVAVVCGVWLATEQAKEGDALASIMPG